MKALSTTHLFVQGLRVLIVVLAGTLALNGASAPLAHASVFTVNSFADAVDANPGDGVCLTVGGVCTLRAAIQEANALPGPDVIALKAGTYMVTILGVSEDAAATGDLDIRDSVTINGVRGDDEGDPETIIDGNGSVTGDRVLQVHGGAAVTFSNLTVRNGNLITGDSGGGIQVSSTGSLTLNSSVVTHNTAAGAGGIRNAGTSLVLDSKITANSTFDGNGGGINNTGVLTVRNSTIDGNKANGPPGTGVGVGGGINNRSGSVTLVNSTVSNNVAEFGAGGIASALNVGTSAILNVTNSTISGNTTSNGDGGGIRVGYVTPGVTQVNLKNVTITKNSAPNGNGGGIWDFRGSVIMKNTLIAGNQDAGGSPDCGSILVSLGNNLIGNGNNCSGFTNGVNGDQVGTNASPINARLSPLAKHGGTTRTHALLPKSPALDAGNACEPTDQRGVARPQGPRCDIGSYERKTSGDADE